MWMLYLLSSFHFGKKSPLTDLRVKVLYPTEQFYFQLHKVLREGDETVAKLTTFAEERP